MGYYINELPNGENLPAIGKADKLLTIDGAKEIGHPFQWEDDIVCVVNNGPFEAAGYAFSPEELNAFARNDGRPKRWFKIPNAKILAKYSYLLGRILVTNLITKTKPQSNEIRTNKTRAGGLYLPR